MTGGARSGRTLADPTRLRIFETLHEGPMTVSFLAGRLGVPPYRLYHHLDLLEAAGIVRVVQVRPRRIYELASPLIGSSELTEEDRAELLTAAFDLARGDVDSARARGDEIFINVDAVSLTKAQFRELSARVAEMIRGYAAAPSPRGRRTRVIFGAIPLAPSIRLTKR